MTQATGTPEPILLAQAPFVGLDGLSRGRLHFTPLVRADTFLNSCARLARAMEAKERENELWHRLRLVPRWHISCTSWSTVRGPSPFGHGYRL